MANWFDGEGWPAAPAAEGKQAFHEGKTLADNPYKGSFKTYAWHDAFCAERDEAAGVGSDQTAA
jgi:hypothetical protein